jgi:hypothetical protein
VQAAREATPAEDGIDFIATDVFAFTPVLPFDFIVSAQFAHQLTDVEVVAFVRWMERFARRGWIISDIHRSAIAYLGFNLLATAARWHHFVRSDGLISITRGFRPDELAALTREVVPASAVTIHRHMPFRLTVERSR